MSSSYFLFTILFMICWETPPQNKEMQWSCCTLFLHMYRIFILEKGIFFYYYYAYVFSFLWKICVSTFLILLEMQYPVAKNDWRWMLWEDGRRRQGNACSRNIMEWEGDLYQGWMPCCYLVMKCQGRGYKDI